jgi:hypothetical protein
MQAKMPIARSDVGRSSTNENLVGIKNHQTANAEKTVAASPARMPPIHELMKIAG